MGRLYLSPFPVLLICVYFIVLETHASHFRGGIIMWEPTSVENETRITYRFAWRRSFGENTFCNSIIKSKRMLIAKLGQIEQFSPRRKTISGTGFYCTDFSDNEDWTQGEYSFTHQFEDKSIQFGFRGAAWINLRSGGGGSWSMRTYADLIKRNDTQKVNSSPTSAMPPIIRLQHGCNHTIKIPVNDRDNDKIRCRWAETSKDECGSVCKTFTNSHLNESLCEIEYSATHFTGWYAAAIQIEDFGYEHSTRALSSIPLQFLIYVFNSDKPCQDKPNFIKPTRSDGACVGVPFNSTWSEKVIARSGADGVRISEITTVSPIGLTKSALEEYHSSSRDWYFNVTWSPSESQSGEKTFCYTASDSDGLDSLKSCIKLFAGVAPPQIISIDPTGDIFPNQTTFSITFDLEFQRPIQSTFAYFYTQNGTLIAVIDVYNNTNVRYPSSLKITKNKTIEINLGIQLKEKEHYYIQLDPGIAKGMSGCGAESSALWNPNEWKFRVRDVTPPVLVYCPCNKNVTGGEILVKYKFNEPVHVICTLQHSGNFSHVNCNETTWRGRNLLEGYYTLLVQGTDLENNTASNSFTWFIDKTGPKTVLTRTPTGISNQRLIHIGVNCDEECKLVCSFHTEKHAEFFSPCKQSFAYMYDHSFIYRGLMDNSTYVFAVKGIDKYGNYGNVTVFSWRTDFQEPDIEPLHDQHVECNHAFDPNVTGRPYASDNTGIKKLTFNDRYLANCEIQRTWKAEDLAGNIKATQQKIFFDRRSKPNVLFPPNTVVACNALEDLTNDVFIPGIKVYHPCGLQMKIYYFDPPATRTQCGVKFNRSWTASDICGNTIKGLQTITVTNVQDPITPNRNEITNLRPFFKWPEIPDIAHYEVYLWIDLNNKRPTDPIYSGYRSWFRVSELKELKPASKYFWLVKFVTNSNTTRYSPRWYFKTKGYPDLAIIDIKSPPIAHSGKSFQVHWKVQNRGTASVSGPWYDRVYIGFNEDFAYSHKISDKRQSRLLLKNGIYEDTVEIPLGDGDIGNAFVFINIDAWQWLDELDRTNNLRRSSKSVHILLTPPPDLIVQRIDIPLSSYSGKRLQVQFSVINQGQGPTKLKYWRDAVYWSTDRLLDEKDTVLQAVVRKGILLPGQSYVVQTSIAIPRYIQGDYFIIVKTDVDNDIFEYVNDNNNWMVSNNLSISLDPPADLSVSDLVLDPTSTLTTGDNVRITWTVTNIGLKEPYVRSWIDRVVLHFGSAMRFIDVPIYTSLQPTKHYTQTLSFVVPPEVLDGDYNISVHTDVHESVFEYQSRDDNIKYILISVIQALPDLQIDLFSANIFSDDLGYNMLNVSWIIRNKGKGMTIARSWTDAVFLEDPSNYLSKQLLLSNVVRVSSLSPNKTYTESRRIRLQDTRFGRKILTLSIDISNEVFEENANNNINLQEIEIPLRSPNLQIDVFELKTEEVIYSGTNVIVWWRVINTENAIPENEYWYDSLSISSTESSFKKHILQTLNGPLAQNCSYAHQHYVQIPDNFLGYLRIKLDVNYETNLFEGGKIEDNSKDIVFRVQSPPSPDLIVTLLQFEIVKSESNLHTVALFWKVKNMGNSMTKTLVWWDAVQLYSLENPSHFIFLAKYQQKLMLEYEAEYTLNKTVVIPSSIVGKYHFHITTDISNNVKEINGENNNGFMDIRSIHFSDPPKPRLKATLISIRHCKVDQPEYLCILYNVSNIGGSLTTKSSWNDAIFMNERGRHELGNAKEVAKISHIGNLLPGEVYIVNTSIIVPTFLRRYDTLVTIYPDYEESANISLSGPGKNDTVILQESHVFQVGQIIPCVNLKVLTGERYPLHRQGGLLQINFNINNNGSCDVDRLFYYAIFLSSDFQNDPFERKIKSEAISTIFYANSTSNFSTTIQIPWRLHFQEYFVVVQVDSRQEIFETCEYDNIATSIVNIEGGEKTDLAVVNVIAPLNVEFGKAMTVQWTMINNGSRKAEGYKCDTVYFSEDSIWDIEDIALGTQQCDGFKISNSGIDVQSLEVPLPPVSSRPYKTIVKTLTNIEDDNAMNDIGISLNSTEITFQIFNLEKKQMFNFTQDTKIVFRIPNVKSGKTLLISTESQLSYLFHETFIKFDKPPTEYDFDKTVSNPDAFKQDLSIPNTKEGDYYFMVKTSLSLLNVGNTYESILMHVKLAKLEVIDIIPKSAAPLGNTTLKITGTLFREDFTALLFNSTYQVISHQTFWFSSSLIAASFDLTKLQMNTSYSLKITNMDTGEETSFHKALSIVKGTIGTLSLKMTMPGPLPPNEKEFINLDLENIGQTDLPSSIIKIKAIGGQLKLTDNIYDTEWSESFTLVIGSSEGPGGILISSEGIRVNLIPRINNPRGIGRLKVSVSSIETFNISHPYADLKVRLKPYYYTTNAWEVIWANFMELVGPTWLSLNYKISDLLNEMSLTENRVLSLNTIIQQLISIADGVGETHSIVDTEDFSTDFDFNTNVKLNMLRSYPRKIGLRRSDGPFGIGWMSKFWDIHLEGMTEVAAFLRVKQQRIIFTAYSFGLYSNKDFGNLSIIEIDSVKFEDISTHDIYIFKITTGQLQSLHQERNSLVFSHDLMGQIKSVRSGEMQMVLEYNKNKKISSVTLNSLKSVYNQKCSYSYTDGRFLSNVQCGERLCSYSYNENGDLIKISENSGEVKLFTYSSSHIFSSHQTVKYERTVSQKTYIHHTNGRIDTIANPGNEKESFWINHLEQVIAYKKEGFPINKVLSKENTFREHIEGDLVVQTSYIDGGYHTINDATGATTRYFEDNIGNLIAFMDGNLNKYFIERLNNGSVKKILYPDNSFEIFQNTESTSLHIDRSGRQTTFHRDLYQRLDFCETDEGYIRYKYGNDGRLHMVKTDEIKINFKYYRYNSTMVVEQTTTDNNSLIQTFNDMQQLLGTEMTDDSYNVFYDYDNNGKVISISDKPGQKKIASYAYNEDGLIKMRILGNNESTHFTYYPRSRLPFKIISYNRNGTLRSEFQYTYDVRGNLRNVKSPEGQYVFSYDLSNQLTEIINPTKTRTTIEYDQNKNRKEVKIDGKSIPYIVDGLNQYTFIGEQKIIYDKSGNLIKRSNITMSFDAHNRLSWFRTPAFNCSLTYNGLGYLAKKKCGDTETIYYFDSFGRMIKERHVDTKEDNFNIYEPDGNLIATVSKGKYEYYQADPFGLLVEVLDDSDTMNEIRMFDPYGKVVHEQDQPHKFIQYNSRLNAITIPELPNIYISGAHVYDAEIGRYLTFDRKRIFCHKPNPYTFSSNNPLNLRAAFHDDYGCEVKEQDTLLFYNQHQYGKRFMTYSLYAENLQGHSIAKRSGQHWHHRQKRSINKGNGLNDLFGPYVNNHLPRAPQNIPCGNRLREVAITEGLKWIQKFIFANTPIGRALDIAGFLWKNRECIFSPCDCLHSKIEKLENAYQSIRQKMDSFIGNPSARVGIMENICMDVCRTSSKTFCGPISHELAAHLGGVWSNVKSISDKVMPVVDTIESAIEDALESVAEVCDFFSDLFEGFTDWIASHDPNDLIGPRGYGAARFISKKTKLVYRIRFENDANATAPAQKVFVEIKFDSKLNARSFRLGSLGFGSFTRKLEFKQAIIQEKINMTEAFGVFVEIKGGLELSKNRAVWEFRSLNASTGLPPTNPFVGFLPPNNGTSGQGFVTFSISPSDDVKSLDKISAKASIIFDQNEPIATPEVFNTIDDTPPHIKNVTVLERPLKSGSLYLNLDIEDNESGLDYVNIMLESENGLVPLLNRVKDSVVSIPVEAGHDYDIAIVPVDRIGNVNQLDSILANNIFHVAFPRPDASCNELKNCSGNGVCEAFNFCSCFDGFYGTTCNTTYPPLDPPLLNVFSGLQINETIPVHVSADVVEHENNSSIVVVINCVGFPEESLFSAGHIINKTLYLHAEDFGDVLFMPPSNYTGNFTMHVIADATEMKDKTVRSSKRNANYLIRVLHEVNEEDRQTFKRTYLKNFPHSEISTTTSQKAVSSLGSVATTNYAVSSPTTTLIVGGISPYSPAILSSPTQTTLRNTPVKSTRNTKNSATVPSLGSIATTNYAVHPIVSSPPTTLVDGGISPHSPAILSSPTQTTLRNTPVMSTLDTSKQPVDNSETKERKDPLKTKVVAGLAAIIGGAFVITVLTVFLLHCRKRRKYEQVAAVDHRRRRRYDESAM